MTNNDELYVILEIQRTASVREIKRAFRKLARRFHPDINPGDHHAEDRFKRITEAYEILSDPSKRQFYDVNGFYTEGVLEPDRNERGWAFSFQGFSFNRSADADFSEIFRNARQTERREPERGEDLEYPVSIGFEESIHGRPTNISLVRLDSCNVCKGSGRAQGSIESACSTCRGAGKTTRTRGHLQFALTCADCGGTGRWIRPCAYCGGEGRGSRTEMLSVALPPGVPTGARIRVSGKGNVGRFGGPAGDLFVVVRVAEHPFFKRMGDNIHCTVPLTIAEAALGTKIEVPTIDGRALVRIPPGTQSGQTLRLRERGAPSLLNPELRGDQYVEVKIVVPKLADERSKQILREFAKLNPENPRSNLW
jgi:molecular chaperone DnaJ